MNILVNKYNWRNFMEFDYDVALSFAGENREYVKEVANILHSAGLNVFYDEFNEINIWGKNLYDEFDDIYRRKSEYCVIFISEYYKQKAWTNHERQSAQARDLIDTGEYILPVRFDDTEIQGLRPTIGFLDARKNTPNDLANKILKKINPEYDVEDMLNILREWLVNYEIKINKTNVTFKCDDEDFYIEFPLSMLLEMYKVDELENTFLMSSILPH